MAKELIGIMGGTLDPVHAGHIAMAEAAAVTAKLDRVLMLPSGNPPHKQGITPAADRWRMLCAAIVHHPKLEACRVQMDREGVIYTVDTLKQLHKMYPKAELFYIIGADTLLQLKNWREYEQVLKLCTFLICPRPWDVSTDELLDERKRLTALGGRFMTVEMTPVDASSTSIRQAISKGENVPQLPLVLREYVGLRGLYGAAARLEHADEMLAQLFADLTAKRFSHTLAVAHTARQLAMLHGVDERKAELAAVLHDCAKCLPLKEMRKICTEHGLTTDESVLESGALMHSIAGAQLAQDVYGVTDPEIIQSIARHTTGCEGMTALDMVVYLADKIEPTRESYPTLDKVRLLAHVSLPKAMLCSMQGTTAHVSKGGKAVHPQTAATIAWLKTQC